MKKQILFINMVIFLTLCLSGAAFAEEVVNDEDITITADAMDHVYVSTTGSDIDGDGTENNPYQTIDKGINSVNPDGTVNVADGTYYEHLIIAKSVNLLGQSQTGTIIDGNNIGRPITINPDIIVTISKFTIKNGNSPDGGGINNNGDLTITDTTITNNTATAIEGYAYGGGIYNHGNLTITNSIISENTVIGGTAYGGGIYSDDNLIINNSTITGNAATSTDGYADGGGISNEFGIITINNSSIIGNVATGDSVYGGGISHSFIGTLTINNSIIIGNVATGGSVYGGGISNWGATITINNSSIKDNTVTGTWEASGGGIYNNGDLIVNKSSITGNTATGNRVYGGGIYNYGDLTITETTLTDNTSTGGTVYGGGIYDDGTLKANFNRIVNNSPNAIYFDIYSDQPDIEYNWWGSNNPEFETLIHGIAPNRWLYMTITADPTNINNGEISKIIVSFNNYTSDGITHTPLPEPLAGHIPDGTPVTFNTDKGSIGSKTINKVTVNGVATATLTANETAGLAHVNTITDGQIVETSVSINPKSSLYLTITPSNENPVVGDTVIYTLKVGNRGPDPASNVVMTYTIPDGLEFAGATIDVGTYTYDPKTRILTWNIGDVPVGDPYMWLSLKILKSGTYQINPQLSTTTYDPTINQNTESITVYAAEKPTPKPGPTPVYGQTVTMQETGAPMGLLVLALLVTLIGMWIPRRK